MVLAASWGVGEVLWSLFWFFLFVMLIWLVVVIFTDIFRSHDLSGWAKALWLLVLVLMPFIGVFGYLVLRGDAISNRMAARTDMSDYSGFSARPSTGDAEFDAMRGRIVGT